MPSAASTITGRKTATKGNVRSAQTIKRLKMYKTRPVRTDEGKIVREAFRNKTAPLDGRVEPNMKWFGNTRVVGQQDLQKMRETIEREANDPNTFLVRSKRLPTALIHEPVQKPARVQDVEPFEQTFGPKAQRKRPKLPAVDLDTIIKSAREEAVQYNPSADQNTAEHRELRDIAYKTEYDPKLVRGQTNRIYAEIYKVIDSSDVLMYVLDARDPEGTRSPFLERYIKLPENEHKHLVFILNKCDLVPTWATASWISKLSKSHPTIAFHASVEHPFGKGELLSVLRQFAQIHKDKQQISVGLCGYPNTGKSSIINTLLGKSSCKTAPVPGETKVWQYVALTKRINLIDAPGVVWTMGQFSMDKAAARDEGGVAQRLQGLETDFDTGTAVTSSYAIDDFNFVNTSDVRLVLNGVLRAERIDHPEKFVPAILQNVKPEFINKTYGLRPSINVGDRWEGDCTRLLEVVAARQGRLLKGGDPDCRSIARKIIEDYTRGRLPHFVAPYTAAEVQEHKATVAAERLRWKGLTDTELISFVNKQNLQALPRSIAVDHEDAFHNAFAAQPADDASSDSGHEPTPETSEQHRARLKTHARKATIDNIDNISDSEDLSVGGSSDEIGSEDWNEAFAARDEEPGHDPGSRKDATLSRDLRALAKAKERVRAGDVDVTDHRVLKTKHKHARRVDGAKRATRILKTKDRELVQAFLSGHVNEDDVAMVAYAHKAHGHKKAKKDRGGYSGEKTGQFFYEKARARRDKIQHSIGKKL